MHRSAEPGPAARTLLSPGTARVLCGASLLLLFAALLLFRVSAFPMQFWDESRVANSALETAHGAGWLVPYYGGQPDHWNSKPPLLIWAEAACLKLGLPTLVALRLPSALAVLGVLLLLVGTLRYLVKDEYAANIVGFILLGSLLYTGPHVGRTADYDALLSFFVLLYVLLFWIACEAGYVKRARWLALCGLFVYLAFLTKGIAAVLIWPGLLVFLLVDTRGRGMLKDYRLWLTCGVLITGMVAYYVSREFLYDPGYFAGVKATELGGRFAVMEDGNGGGVLFYPFLLLQQFQPGCLFVLLVPFTFRSGDNRRRSLSMVCLLSSASLLLVLTASRTKLFWYLAPMLPLLSLSGALAVSDLLKWIQSRDSSLPWILRFTQTRLMVAAILLVFCSLCLYRNQVHSVHAALGPDLAQLWYGRLYSELLAKHAPSPVWIVDDGVRNGTNLAHYNPILTFYANWAGQSGLATHVIPPGSGIGDARLVASCDPISIKWLKHSYTFSTQSFDGWCFSGQPLAELQPAK